jgi:alanyl-tRNA synthetase
MNARPRLYYDDPLLLSFEARVAAHGSFGGAPSIVLDRSAFYPESGGQMADRGVLGDLAVIDVQVDDAGVVHHLVQGELLPVGSPVRGEVDRARRRVHMALHTGQHMLSRALEDVAGAATVSSRLGETSCTIDVDRDALDERRVAEAEALVNAVIDDDAPVRAFFPEAAELASLPLRRAPKVAGDVRVIEIGAFDVSPCGGTHCLRTAQVGLVKVLGIERYKGKARVSFAAGGRARAELWESAEVLGAVGRSFTCGARDVPNAIEKLRRELGDARAALGRARGRLAEAVAAEIRAGMASGHRAHAVLTLDDAPVELLRAVATRVLEDSRATVLLAGRSAEGVAVVVARGSEATLDCGAFLRRAAAALGGRGGGRAEHAEGRLPPGAAWDATVASLLDEVSAAS